jgi:hypothetical protein
MLVSSPTAAPPNEVRIRQAPVSVAFEMTCAALRYTKRPDVAHEAVANRIIELAKNGVRNPDRLCERVLDDLRKLPPHL